MFTPSPYLMPINLNNWTWSGKGTCMALVTTLIWGQRETCKFSRKTAGLWWIGVMLSTFKHMKSNGTLPLHQSHGLMKLWTISNKNSTYFRIFPPWHYEGRYKFIVTVTVPHDKEDFLAIAHLFFTADIRLFQEEHWMWQLFGQFTTALQHFGLFTLQHHLPSSSYFCFQSCT